MNEAVQFVFTHVCLCQDAVVHPPVVPPGSNSISMKVYPAEVSSISIDLTNVAKTFLNVCLYLVPVSISYIAEFTCRSVVNNIYTICLRANSTNFLTSNRFSMPEVTKTCSLIW